MGVDSAYSGSEYTSMRSSIWILIVCGLLAGCDFRKSATPPTPDNQAKLTVFAAASLTNAFTEIADAFETTNPSVQVILHFAGSQQLAQQIKLGAPADVFASANRLQMQTAIESGRIKGGTPHAFAHNKLSAIIPPSNPANLHTIEDLAKPGLLIVLADIGVPIGHYTHSFLDRAALLIEDSYKENVLANVASYEQNVQAVLTKVSLGEADAGIVYTSDLTGNPSVLPVNIPDPLNLNTVYPIATLSDSSYPEIAQAFTVYVRSHEGQRILAKHGFISEDPA